MKLDGIENLHQVLTDFIENAADHGIKHQLVNAEAAVGELSKLTGGAIKWDDFLTHEDVDYVVKP